MGQFGEPVECTKYRDMENFPYNNNSFYKTDSVLKRFMITLVIDDEFILSYYDVHVKFKHKIYMKPKYDSKYINMYNNIATELYSMS